MSAIRHAVKLLQLACQLQDCETCFYHYGKEDYCGLSLPNAGCPGEWHTENDSLEVEDGKNTN